MKREERFAKTAVGWSLRDISKYDPGLVIEFIDDRLEHFSSESLRNSLKYFEENDKKRIYNNFTD